MWKEALGFEDPDRSIKAPLIIIGLFVGSILLLVAILMTDALAATPG